MLSTIFVTHDQEEALSISDSIAVMRGGKLEQLGKPEEIYREPATRFVAEFVTQANFLPATWREGAWETEVGRFADEGGGRSDRADLMVRQEDIILHPDPGGTVLVRDRSFLGREHRYCLQTRSGRELIARIDAHKPLPVGSKVKISVAPQNWQLFTREEV